MKRKLSTKQIKGLILEQWSYQNRAERLKNLKDENGNPFKVYFSTISFYQNKAERIDKRLAEMNQSDVRKAREELEAERKAANGKWTLDEVRYAVYDISDIINEKGCLKSNKTAMGTWIPPHELDLKELDLELEAAKLKLETEARAEDIAAVRAKLAAERAEVQAKIDNPPPPSPKHQAEMDREKDELIDFIERTYYKK